MVTCQLYKFIVLYYNHIAVLLDKLIIWKLPQFMNQPLHLFVTRL